MTTQPISERVALDVLAVQCVLVSGVPHEDVAVWERVREERLIALVHDIAGQQDPAHVLRAIDAINDKLDAGDVRDASEVVRIVEQAMGAQRV
jgi:hypothetical protein